MMDTEIWRKGIRFNAIKFNASRWHRTSVLGVLFFAVGMVFLPISAKAQCAKTWDGSGEWEIRQGPAGRTTVIRLNLKQSGMALSGTATRNVRTGSTKGKVFGDADGDSFTLGIDWLDGSGEYTTYKAKVSASGKLEGETYIGSNKRNRDTWYSEQPLTCGWSPGKSRGNLTSKLSADAPVKTSELAVSRQPKPPFITAGQVIVIPHLPFASVYLGWDGGPDHPNVEVWVSIDNGAEIPAFSDGYAPQHPIFKQPTIAAIELKLQKSRLYKFVLKDGGTTLSTVAFYVPPVN